VRESDLELIYRLMTDVSQKGEYWLIDIPAEPAFRRGFADRGFWHERFGRLVIIDQQDAGRIVGEIIYFCNADYRAGYEVGYQIFRREDRGKGYMSEALALFSSFLFESKPIPRLQLTVVPAMIPAAEWLKNVVTAMKAHCVKRLFLRENMLISNCWDWSGKNVRRLNCRMDNLLSMAGSPGVF
jgi:hypothetical protein